MIGFLLVTNILALCVFVLLNRIFKFIISIAGYPWFYWNVYLHTPHWKFTKWLKKKIYGRYCEKCKRWTGDIVDIHHISYAHKWWEFLHLRDLQVLCRAHHEEEHRKQNTQHGRRKSTALNKPQVRTGRSRKSNRIG